MCQHCRHQIARTVIVSDGLIELADPPFRVAAAPEATALPTALPPDPHYSERAAGAWLDRRAKTA